MVSVDEAVIAKLKKEGNVYEILVDCELALDYKYGKEIPIHDILATQAVFKDARKGLPAPELNKVFGTDSIEKIASEIIKKGEVQLTKEYREKLVGEKRLQVVNFISQNAIDTRTNSPVPPQRVELAIGEIGFNIEPFRPVQEQALELIEKLRPIIPMSTKQKELKVIIPAQWVAKTYGAVKKLATIKKEEWLNNGSWSGEVTIPAGMINDFMSQLNNATQGNVDIQEK